jgi:hypothetical protein
MRLYSGHVILQKTVQKSFSAKNHTKSLNVIVHLKEQVRITDPDWLHLLQHVCHGNCGAHHIKLLRSLITESSCPPTDFTTPPWNEALLMAPRHAVRKQWNTIMA